MRPLICTLIYQTSWRGGPPAGSRRRLSGDALDIGRGAACPVHLPDPRVKLLHATLRRGESGGVRIEAEPDALISIDGRLERTAKLIPGTRVAMGPFRLTVTPASDGADLALEIDHRDAPTDMPPLAGERRLSLAALGISQWRWGWILASLILGGGLVLLALARMSPAFERWQSGLPVSLSGLLSPGPLVSGHAVLGNRCSACHQQAFRAVANTACSECHLAVSRHLTGTPSTDTAVPEVGCIDCHPAHTVRADAGRRGMPACVRCHADLRRRVADVGDFARGDLRHPEFRVTVVEGERSARYRPGDPAMPADNNGLKFSHRVHLDREGVSSPDGNTVLNCVNCHRPDAGGEHFAPMTLEGSCQQSRCHRIRLDPPATGFAPHGSERAVLDRLRVALINDPESLRPNCPPGTGEPPLRRIAACAERRALEIAGAGLFREEGGKPKCALCHTITRRDDPGSPWKIAPVRISRDWFPSARFPHRQHQTTPCTDCHDKSASAHSEEISLPGIELCRRCHAGAQATSDRVASPCESCHLYHRHNPTPAATG